VSKVRCFDEPDYAAKQQAMLEGPNRQPCFVCGQIVKAEYCFCHRCCRIFCITHFREHDERPT